MWKGLPCVQARTSLVVHTRPAEGRALQSWASEALPGRSSPGHRQAPRPSLTGCFLQVLLALPPTGDQQPHSVLRGRKVTGPPSSRKEFLALQVCCFLKGSPGLAPAPDVCPEYRLGSASAQNTKRPTCAEVSAGPSEHTSWGFSPDHQCSSRRPQEVDWPGRRVVALPGPYGALRGGGCSAAGS